jgi:DNA-binding MarR family transcriptional regulator
VQTNGARTNPLDDYDLVIPAALWKIKTLSVCEKAILAKVIELDRGKGCFAGNDKLADWLGLKTRQTRKLINRLLDQGYLTRLAFDGRRRYLQVSPAFRSAWHKSATLNGTGVPPNKSKGKEASASPPPAGPGSAPEEQSPKTAPDLRQEIRLARKNRSLKDIRETRIAMERAGLLKYN